MKLPLIIFAGVLLVIGVLYATLFTDANTSNDDSSAMADFPVERIETMRKMQIHPAPLPVRDTEFFDPAGNTHLLADSNGKVRLVNFWATWCAPCREEMPALDRLQTRLGGADFAVMTIATGRNELAGIERFFNQTGVENLPILLDPDSALGELYGAIGLPLTVVLDAQGRELARVTGGAEWDSDNAVEILNEFIAMGKR